MRKLSLTQLKEEYVGREYDYSFTLDDQEERLSSYITTLDLVFDTMVVSSAQNLVCLQSMNGNSMLFDDVRFVEEYSSSDIGSVIDIICKSRFDEQRKYRVWAKPRAQ